MKTVFIFGAGASRDAGAPLMSEFFDKSEQLLRLNQVSPVKAQFEDVFKAIAELQSVHSKSYLDLDNLESVFSAIEMGLLIGKFSERTHAEIKSLRDSMIILIVNTLEQCVKFPTLKNPPQINAPAPYGKFVEMLKKISAGRSVPIHEFSFITFNYDLALDFALHRGKILCDYYLTGDIAPISKARPLLKLHGSINWGTCAGCQQIIPLLFSDFTLSNDLLDELTGKIFDFGTNLSKLKRHCDRPLQQPPVIVPPTWNKTNPHHDLINVWKRAAIELGDAENVFVIGYSLPSTDLFFHYLFALGSESKTRIKRFWIFNPEPMGSAVEQRFRALIGPGIEKRFQYVPMRFDQSIPHIESALQEL